MNGAVIASASGPVGALTLRASALDLEGVKYATPGAMHSVEFFAGNCSLGQDMGNKGNFSVSTSLLAENGTYYLTAVATDVDGNRVTSDAVLIHVGNRPPVVAFVSPAPGDNIESGSIELVANATDADGSVSKVEFFLEGTSLGIAARSHGSPTYKINWTLQANGPSLLTVIATDDAGTSASAVVGITVGATLTTSPRRRRRMPRFGKVALLPTQTGQTMRSTANLVAATWHFISLTWLLQRRCSMSCAAQR